MKCPISETKQRCGAFKETCPYAKLCDENVKNCPAFNEGCPFKNAQDLAQVHGLLSKIPVSHSQGRKVLDIFKKIHTVSANEKSVLGKCPVFHDENGKPCCPFKSVQSEGKHLVQPVTDVLEEQNFT